MKYHILAKIVGPYLPKELSFGDVFLKQEHFFDFPEYPNLPVRDESSDEHLIKKGVEYRIQYLKEKINLRSFSSGHLVRVIIEECSPYQAKEKALLRIEHLVESLNLAAFSKEKVRDGKILDRSINDLYQYELLGVYIEDSGILYKVKVPFLTSGVNFFPEPMDGGLEEITKDMLTCNDSVVIKALKYLKRAKEFSYEHFSELEVFLNSIKCIELICLAIYPKGTKRKKLIGNKEKMVEMSFLDKLDGTLDKDGIVKILSIEKKYRDFAKDAWDSRSNYDYAHASEHDKLIPTIFSHKVNETAYHFLLKYVLYLKGVSPSSFYRSDVLKDDDWWEIFL